MNSRLTLRLDGQLIRKAKRHSRRSGKSVSQLVADYFALIDTEEQPPQVELTDRVRSLLGALGDRSLTKDDHIRHLESKHQ